MKKGTQFVLPILFLAAPFFCFSQVHHIQGKVLDTKTSEPVAFAHVFINNSTIGTYTDEFGNFQIESKEALSDKLEIVFSHTSYQKLILILSSLKEEVLMQPRIDELFEVVVTTSKDKAWNKRVKIFEKEFLGYSFNAKHCEVVNPEVLDFEEQDYILTAEAFGPVKISNNALGYEIDYYLDHFEINLISQLPRYFGSYFVTEMETNNFALKKKWEKNRAKAYRGSFNHFISTLLSGNLEVEGYSVNDPSLISFKNVNNDIYIYIEDELEITFEEEYQSLSYLNWKKKYSGMVDPRNGAKERAPQFTVVKPLDGYIHVAGKKFILNPDRILLKGYMGWERMAEFVPNNYSVN